MEKVDILMATYNGEKYIEEQIQSILNQTHQNFRLLISDDCSKDNTRKILKKLAEKDNRITLNFQNENLGVVKNFEFLLKNVENDFFMFADQDDYWYENKIELSLNKLKEENADLVYTDLEVVDSNLSVINKSYWDLKSFRKKIQKYNNFEALYLNNFITGCTIFCKKEWIDKILPLPKTSKYVLHDYWIALMVSLNGKISFVDKPLIKYRQHGNNSVGSKTVSETLETLEEIRNLFINVKLDHFELFVKNSNNFNENINKLSKKSLQYYQKLESTKYFNFSKLGMFFKLYKYEPFSYKIKNLIILHFPILARIIFKIIKEKK